MQHSLLSSFFALYLALAASHVDADSAEGAAIQSFWRQCQEYLGFEENDTALRIRHFGHEEYVAELLVTLIAAGEKTGTFTSPWLFEGNRNATPVLGGYTVVTDFAGNPRLLLKTTSVRTMRFDEISETETSVDGPAIRTLDVWRQVHWAYFEREMVKLGRTPSKDMPVTMELFEVICDSDALE